MAEQFKNNSIAVTSSEQLFYTAPSADANDVSIILSLRVTNIDGTSADDVTVTIYESDGTTKKADIASTMVVSADSSIELAGSSKIVLASGEQVKITGVAASGDLEAFISVLDITV